MCSYINYYYSEFLLQIILQFQLGYSTKKRLITKSLQFMLPKDPGVSTYVCMCACKYVCACFVCACFVCVCAHVYCVLRTCACVCLSNRGVLESLIKKNFPTSDVKKTAAASASRLDLSLFNDDITLPPSLRKRLRGNGKS